MATREREFATWLSLAAIIALGAACSAGGRNITRMHIFDDAHGVMYLHLRSIKDGTLPTLLLKHESGAVERLSPVSPFAKEARYVEELPAGAWCILKYETEFLDATAPCTGGEAMRFTIAPGKVTYVGRLDVSVVKDGPSGAEMSLDVIDEEEAALKWFSDEYPRFAERYVAAPMQFERPGGAKKPKAADEAPAVATQPSRSIVITKLPDEPDGGTGGEAPVAPQEE